MACGAPLQPIHGHGACLRSDCPMFGVNQDPCCAGQPLHEPDPVRPRPSPIPWRPPEETDPYEE